MPIMLDIETLSTTNKALIISIGAVRFTKTEVKKDNFIYGELSREDGEGWGRDVEERCLKEFWEPLGGYPEGDIKLDVALKGLNQYIGIENESVWCAGPHFDIAILQDSYEAVGLKPAWPYWLIRDYRTIRDTVGRHVVRDTSPTHNALEDCVQQAEHLIAIHKAVGNVIR